MVYSYDRRHLVAKTTPDQIRLWLGQFEHNLNAFEKSMEDYRLKDTPSMYETRAKVFTEGVFQRMGGGFNYVQMLILGVLSTYQMSPRERKLLEKAAKFFGKSRILIRKKKPVEAMSKLISEWHVYLDTMKRIVAAGKEHEEGTGKWKAGPFTLINTGGFDDKTMQEAVKVVEKSTRLLQSKGLGKVCYGDVQITNTVHRSTRVLAFYTINEDELYVRANLKGKLGPAVRSVSHELAHRLQFKFLKSKTAEIKQIYRNLQNQDERLEDELIHDKSLWPVPGAEVKQKGETFVVTKVVYPTVWFVVKGTEVKASMPLLTWVKVENKGRGGPTTNFITGYAKTDPDENFAEMVAHYVEDLLPDDQVQLLKRVL